MKMQSVSFDVEIISQCLWITLHIAYQIESFSNKQRENLDGQG